VLFFRVFGTRATKQTTSSNLGRGERSGATTRRLKREGGNLKTKRTQGASRKMEGETSSSLRALIHFYWQDLVAEGV